MQDKLAQMKRNHVFAISGRGGLQKLNATCPSTTDECIMQGKGGVRCEQATRHKGRRASEKGPRPSGRLRKSQRASVGTGQGNPGASASAIGPNYTLRAIAASFPGLPPFASHLFLTIWGHFLAQSVLYCIWEMEGSTFVEGGVLNWTTLRLYSFPEVGSGGDY